MKPVYTTMQQICTHCNCPAGQSIGWSPSRIYDNGVDALSEVSANPKLQLQLRGEGVDVRRLDAIVERKPAHLHFSQPRAPSRN